MDRIDACLLRQLLLQGRAPLRELAAAAGVSIASTHARLLSLEESGIIPAHTALIDPAVFGGHTVLVHGHCDRPATDALVSRIGADARVFEIAVGSGNALTVWLAVRSEQDREHVLAMLRETAGMASPATHVSQRLWLRGEPPSLSALDAAIALTLRNHGRLPIRSIAQRVQASERRVRARLSHLLDTDVLSVAPAYDPVETNDPFVILLVRTATSDGYDAVIQACGEAMITSLRFTPSELLFSILWSPKMSLIAELTNGLHALPGVEHVQVLQFYKNLTFPVWIDDRLARIAASCRS